MERNINSLTGYGLQATDGEIGDIVDFYFDDETWTIRYLVVKTGIWLSGRKVLVSAAGLGPTVIRPGLFSVNLTREQIRSSPDISTEKPVSRQQEAILKPCTTSSEVRYRSMVLPSGKVKVHQDILKVYRGYELNCFCREERMRISENEQQDRR